MKRRPHIFLVLLAFVFALPIGLSGCGGASSNQASLSGSPSPVDFQVDPHDNDNFLHLSLLEQLEHHCSDLTMSDPSPDPNSPEADPDWSCKDHCDNLYQVAEWESRTVRMQAAIAEALEPFRTADVEMPRWVERAIQFCLPMETGNAPLPSGGNPHHGNNTDGDITVHPL